MIFLGASMSVWGHKRVSTHVLQVPRETRMKWNQRYVIISYLRSTIWTVPVIALAIEQAIVRTADTYQIDFGYIAGYHLDKVSILAAMDYVITAMISFIVFTFGSLLVAIQVASGQLTPRIIATTLLRDNMIRFTVGLFAFTLYFAAGVKARSDDRILQVGGTLAVFLGIGSTMAFLFLIDYTARMLRPVAIVWRIGEQGIEVIESIYPDRVDLPRSHTPTRVRLGAPARVVEHRGKSAVVLAMNLKALVAAARDGDGVIECVQRVGN